MFLTLLGSKPSQEISFNAAAGRWSVVAAALNPGPADLSFSAAFGVWSVGDSLLLQSQDLVFSADGAVWNVSSVNLIGAQLLIGDSPFVSWSVGNVRMRLRTDRFYLIGTASGRVELFGTG